jgi:hypothetical protein
MLGGNATHGKHDTRRDQGDLTFEIGRAASGFCRLGVAVVRRPALQDVGDEDILAAEPDRPEHRVQQLACAADEGLSEAILVRTGRLADDHQIGIAPTDAEYGLRSRPMQLAERAGTDLAFEAVPLGACGRSRTVDRGGGGAIGSGCGIGNGTDSGRFSAAKAKDGNPERMQISRLCGCAHLSRARRMRRQAQITGAEAA